MKFFSIDSPFYKFMQRLWDVVKLNLVWLVCSLPVVTLGCSTIAAFSVTLRMTEDKEGDVVKDFFKAFKANWKQGIPMSFIMILCPISVWYDFQIYNAIEENSIIFLIIGMITAYLFFFCLIYVFPLLARYENTIINSLKNSYKIGLKHIGRTIILALVLAFELVIWFWNTTTLFVGFLIGPICIMFTISGTAMYIFRKLEEDPATTRESEKHTDEAAETENETEEA